MAVHLAVTGDVIDGVFILCCPFSNEMYYMRSGTESSQFLRVFLPTLDCRMLLQKLENLSSILIQNHFLILLMTCMHMS